MTLREFEDWCIAETYCSVFAQDELGQLYYIPDSTYSTSTTLSHYANLFPDAKIIAWMVEGEDSIEVTILLSNEQIHKFKELMNQHILHNKYKKI